MTSFEPGARYDAVQKVWYPLKNANSEGPADASMGEIIYEELQRESEKIAQISASEHTILTKRELLQNAVRIATRLREFGIGQDDIVGLVVRNTTHVAALAFALLFNGTAFHALNPGLIEDTIGKLFNITKPKLIFCDAPDYDRLTRVCPQAKIYIMKPERTDVPSIEELLQTPIDLEHFRPSTLQHGIRQTMAILSTSGTTGIPKAVPISNSHQILYPKLEVLPNDVIYGGSTIDWLSGIAVMLSVTSGITRIISDVPVEPREFLEMVQQYKITIIYTSPSQVGMLLNCEALAPKKLDTLRRMICVGGSCTLAMEQEMQAQLNYGILIHGYASTETSCLVAMNYKLREKPGSVGSLVGTFRFKIIDELGCSLGPGEEGEICCTNGKPWPGYIGNMEETQQVYDSEGWLHTGDIGYFDADNYLYLINRKKEMLKYQGLMYYPNEVEQIVAQMPTVWDVCAFGIWNEIEGDAAAVAVVKRQGAQLTPAEVVDFVKSTTSQKYLQLNGGAFIVDYLEKSPNGKVNRTAVKNACLNILNNNKRSV